MSIARMNREKVYRFDVAGQEVLCYHRGEDRLWVCDCAYFRRTQREYELGFCPHTAAAMLHAMGNSTIDF